MSSKPFLYIILFSSLQFYRTYWNRKEWNRTFQFSKFCGITRIIFCNDFEMNILSKKQNGKLSITFKTVFHVVSFPRIDDNFFVFQCFFVVIQQAFFANIHHLVLQNENIPKNYVYFTCYSNNLTKIINRIWNRQKPSFNIKSHITSFSFRFFKIK